MTEQDIDRAVDAFAAEMKLIATLNDSPGVILDDEDIQIEIEGFAEEIAYAVTFKEHREAREVTVRLANYCMMIYDNTRRQELAERGEK
ncbi:MAG: hypothetical protein ABIH23_16850 [bacterium]